MSYREQPIVRFKSCDICKTEVTLEEWNKRLISGIIKYQELSNKGSNLCEVSMDVCESCLSKVKKTMEKLYNNRD